MLPLFIQEIIKKKLDRLSLLNLAYAFPEFSNIVYNSKYWKTFQVYLDSEIIALDEFLALVNQFGKFLECLCFNSELINNYENVDDLLNKINHIETLKIFKFKQKSIVHSICSNLLNLKFFKLEYEYLNNEHIKKISKNLKYLDSFWLSTSLDVNESVEYMITNMNHVLRFGFNIF